MENNTNNPIEYFSITGAPGEYFKCPRYHGNATLSVTACANQWRRAKQGDDEARIRLHACINCPIGAKHAGVDNFIPLNPIQTQKICTRCHRPASRIIYGRLCVSCANRQYEVLKGKNARGNKPSQCPDLYPMHVLIKEGNRKGKDVEFLASDTLEAMLSAIKTAKDKVFIGFTGMRPRPAAEQLALF